jgi:ribosome maturation factor RimP
MIERNRTSKESEIESIIKPFLEKEEFSLVECCFVEGKNQTVRLFIYNKNNTSVDRLALLNKKIYPVLSDISFLKKGFDLEVSSPGLNRLFRYIEEFDIFSGRKIKLVTSDGLTFTGKNEGLTNSEVSITVKDAGTLKFEIGNIVKAYIDE